VRIKSNASVIDYSMKQKICRHLSSYAG